MAAETEAAEDHQIDWALGCLWAALADRGVRDRWFLMSLMVLPAVAFLLVALASLLVSMTAYKFGVRIHALIPIMLIGPLPCAWLLGKIRPAVSPTLVGTTAFLVHQSTPLLAMWMLFGIAPVSFWAANLSYYNMPPLVGLLASWFVWVAGTWWGTRSGKRTARRTA